MRRNALPVMVAVVLAGLFACEEPPEPTADTIPAVKYERVSERATGQVRELSGVVEPAEKSTLSFQVDGNVASVFVQQGDSVVSGQVLARLDPRDYELRVDSARARLQSARSDYEAKREDLRRQETLFEKSFVAEAAVQKARTAADAARSQIAVAQSELEAAERNLENTALGAPFDGQVSVRSIEPFVEVRAGEPAFEIQATGGLEVAVLMPESIIRFIEHGQAAKVRFPTLPDAETGGTVTEIGTDVASGNAFPVRVAIAGAPPAVRTGMTATVRFSYAGYLDGRTAYLIPVSAIAIDGLEPGRRPRADVPRKATVFVFDSELSQMRKREVMVGDIRGNRIEIFEGLEEGDRIAVAGVPFLRDGMEVSLWEPGP